MRGRAGVVCALFCGIAALALPGIAQADIGIQGPAYAGTGGSPTGSKPESKLWWNDGFWWASMFDNGSGAYRIFRLNGSSWTNVGPQIDTRDSTRQDVLSVGGKLFVASHKFQSVTAFSQALESAPNPRVDGMLLYRFTYNTNSNSYSLDDGFPVVIDRQRSEALVIDRAQDNKIWATWVQQQGAAGPHRVFTSHTSGNCLTGSAANCDFTPREPVGAAVSADDISSLIRFGTPSRIGIMWSSQLENSMRFVAVSPPADFGSVETAISGAKQADDHINMKTTGGTVYVATKTKFSSRTALNPQTRLLVRSAAGNWSAHTISFSPDRRTRPIVVLDTTNGIIHVFETGPHPSGQNPEIGGSIFENKSNLNSINFAVLSRRPVIEDSNSAGMNNATSTKQNISATTNLAVLATNGFTDRYWHRFDSITASEPPPPGGGGGGCTIRGSAGPDIIRGTARRDVICGLGGNDIIRGLAGNDRLLGGVGNDVLVGGAGIDGLLGQVGNDLLLGQTGNDYLVGSYGRDRLYGQFGHDRLLGGFAGDRLIGGYGRDRLSGWSGNDVLSGGPGRDRLVANSGRDTIWARDGYRELVSGGFGFDRARVNSTDARRSIERLF
jgi:RTX calcium-binding nonapeptide repeat (4 copies)